jgi:hypothetical protein
MARTLIEPRPTSGDSDQTDRIRFRDIPRAGKFLLITLFAMAMTMVFAVTVLVSAALST